MEKKNILIIEDSPTQAHFTALLLAEEGYHTVIAGAGQQGVEMATMTPPDLILLDVILPDMDGYQVCTRLRQEIPTYVPILMFTDQKVAVEDKVDGLAAGADDYISKSFDPRELLARVTALLRIKQIIDDLFNHLTSERQAYQSLKRIALTDQLTGLYNRHYFTESLEREFALAERHHSPLGCIMADIDHFRDFNNRYGHPIGDWVLRGISGLMKDNLRQGDLLARYGGEEFIIILPMTPADVSVSIASRICDLIGRRAWESPAGDLHITISLGVANMTTPGITTPDLLISCADQALYKAKSLGRNRVQLYDW